MSSERSTILQYPSSRQFTFDIGKLGAGKHYVRGMVEVDVTEALRKIKENRSPTHKVTLASWLIKVTADTVLLHPPLNGVRLRGNKVLVYDDVDVSLTIEKEINGTAVPLPVVIREANHKTAAEINIEIQAAKEQSIIDEKNYVLGEKPEPFSLKLAAALPQWLRLIFWRRYILGKRMKSIMGTVMVTAVGMVGSLNGWIVPSGIHPLLIAVGSLNKQPVFHDGEVQKREILHLTIAVDHDVIDGIPAMRFCDDLVRRLEAGEGV
jgi:pyruvate/2-oxoglutarate dehydrogenase complex dihydrolipoamide acyltransferase (E2) component